MTVEWFDASFEDGRPASAQISEVIWGCKAIGRAINRSADYVRDTLAKQPGSPVRREGREYYARRDELDAFFR